MLWSFALDKNSNMDKKGKLDRKMEIRKEGQN